MKKRVWASSPIFFVILAIMFAMTAATYFIGQTALFYVELGVSVVATIAVAVSLHFETYVGGAVKAPERWGAGLPGPAGFYHGGCRGGRGRRYCLDKPRVYRQRKRQP
ncbi:MAG: hypothetical protein ACLSB9_31465 [Hydrogeniiclostridium mannosilyticum]